MEEVEEKEPAHCCWPTTVCMAVAPLTTGAAAPRAAHYIHVHINIRVHIDAHIQIQMCRGSRRYGWSCRLLTFSARRLLHSGHRCRGRW